MTTCHKVLYSSLGAFFALNIIAMFIVVDKYTPKDREYSSIVYTQINNYVQNNIHLQQSKEAIEQKYIQLKDTINTLHRTKNRTIQVTMGMNKEQLRTAIVRVLEYLDEMDVNDYAALLLLTAQTESDMGYLRKQKNGVALSPFQVEPFTEREIWNVFLKARPRLFQKIDAIRGNSVPGLTQLETNLEYSIAIAYCVYKWRIDKAPNKNDIVKQAEYHKKYYNTFKGKAEVSNTLFKTVGVI